MVLSIRKVATEQDDLTGAGIWWFKNLNDPDPYLILPIVATLLNYINLGVSFILFDLLFREALLKKMSIGLSIDLGLSFKFYSFSICLLHMLGQLVLLYIG